MQLHGLNIEKFYPRSLITKTSLLSRNTDITEYRLIVVVFMIDFPILKQILQSVSQTGSSSYYCESGGIKVKFKVQTER